MLAEFLLSFIFILRIGLRPRLLPEVELDPLQDLAKIDRLDQLYVGVEDRARAGHRRQADLRRYPAPGEALPEKIQAERLIRDPIEEVVPLQGRGRS